MYLIIKGKKRKRWAERKKDQPGGQNVEMQRAQEGGGREMSLFSIWTMCIQDTGFERDYAKVNIDKANRSEMLAAAWREHKLSEPRSFEAGKGWM